MARVGPRWRHRGILHRPGRVRWHRKDCQRVVRLTAGWVGFLLPQPRGRCVLFAADLPPETIAMPPY